MKNSTKKFGVKILAFLVLIIGSIAVLEMSVKVISTSVALVILRDNASFYNEQARKTDAMTAKYEKNHEERQNLYNSKDIIVRKFSNMHGFSKIAFLLLAIAMWPAIPYMWFKLFQFYFIHITNKKRRKMNQQKQRAANHMKQKNAFL